LRTIVKGSQTTKIWQNNHTSPLRWVAEQNQEDMKKNHFPSVIGDLSMLSSRNKRKRHPYFDNLDDQDTNESDMHLFRQNEDLMNYEEQETQTRRFTEEYEDDYHEDVYDPDHCNDADHYYSDYCENEIAYILQGQIDQTLDESLQIVEGIQSEVVVPSQPQPYINRFREFSKFKSAKKYQYIYENKERDDLLQVKLVHDSNSFFWTVYDYCLGELILRQKYSHRIGDDLSNAHFLLALGPFGDSSGSPELKKFLESSSEYEQNQLIFSVLRKENVDFPCLIFKKCLCGKFTFSKNTDQCPICNKAKPKEKCPVYYIFPFTPRLRALLEADILDKLFDYEEYREITPDTITDIYDSQNWKTFKAMMGRNEKLIGLELSWDGTCPFDKSTSSIWPLFCSILNFPSNIRGKLFSGMHLLALDDGDYCIWDAIIKELQDLWLNGMWVNGIKWRVAVLRVTLDGRGLEYLTKTSGFEILFLSLSMII
jgi:hypothetical protein